MDLRDCLPRMGEKANTLVTAIACLFFVANCPGLQAAAVKLRFNNEGTFKILQVADMHYGNGRTTDCSDVRRAQRPYCSDLNTTAFVRRLIQNEAPDLIVFSGDNIGWTASDAKRSMDQAFSPAIEARIPWAAVLGNHDVESNLNRPQLMDYISRMPFSLASVQNPQIDGTYGWGNYYLQVYGPTGGEKEKTTLLNLYFLDSGDRSKVAGVPGYDWIRASQIYWFSKLSQQLKVQANYVQVPALAYFHIPIPEYDAVVYQDKIVGVQQEDVFSSPVNSGFFASLVENGDVKATFVGHDHVNDYCGKLMGINLCYGGGTGYHAYGKIGWPRRARVVVASVDKQGTSYSGAPNITTWKRLDDSKFSKQDVQLLYSKSLETISKSNTFAYRKGCCRIWTGFKYRQGLCSFWNIVIDTGVVFVVIGGAFLWGFLLQKCTSRKSLLSAHRLVKPEAKIED